MPSCEGMIGFGDQELKRIEEEIKACKRCNLWATRRNPVVGDGNPRARIMFIGEAPGAKEDMQGKPFVGAAGKILDSLLASINLRREEIYITNVLKCRPPGNRNPNKGEIKACSPFLYRQIEAIKPEIICTLGKFATDFVFERYKIKKEGGISKLHGRVYEASGVKIIPLYHPAVAIYNAEMRNTLREDFKVIKGFL
ncbi:MAG: uracil-DNA glycosylase family protein [Candidatus Methanospirareceae archaeon]